MPSPLARAATAYANANRTLDAERVAFVQAIQHERERGRSWRAIGEECGVAFQQLHALVKSQTKRSER